MTSLFASFPNPNTSLCIYPNLSRLANVENENECHVIFIRSYVSYLAAAKCKPGLA
jgi:hypothetical protein